MLSLKLLAPLVALSAVAAPPVAPAAHSLFASRELWATVDVCSPKDQLNTIGIRGSMPSDGHRGDTMFMRFQVQYVDETSKKWVYVAKGADSGFQPVTATAAVSQSGRSFQLVPTAGPFRLRGVVSFQWRRGGHVVHATTLTTTPGHNSLDGADPKGFSAGTCKIG
jgi:hypothetical protein